MIVCHAKSSKSDHDTPPLAFRGQVAWRTGHLNARMTPMTEGAGGIELGVAEAKARFSELIDRVAKGERFQITKRGRRVVELVRPGEAPPVKTARVGLAALAGALADWEELPAVVEQIYEARRMSKDRRVPEVD